MDRQKVWSWMDVLLALVMLGTVLLTSCSPRLRVGALRSETQSVDLDDASPVQAKINYGAGDLELSGGADKLLEADFTYNVARLKPEVKYSDGTLVVQQPDAEGLPSLRGISDFRNEWDLRLNDEVPMDLSVEMGAGTSNLKLSGLALTRLNFSQGAGESTVDLSGDWQDDLDVSIDAGAADITVRLPSDVGVRVEVGSGPHTIKAAGLSQDGNVYTNSAYGTSDVTLQIDLEIGIGNIDLDEE